MLKETGGYEYKTSKPLKLGEMKIKIQLEIEMLPLFGKVIRLP